MFPRRTKKTAMSMEWATAIQVTRFRTVLTVKGETQTADEFKSDIEVLKEMWHEKLADKDFY